MAAPKTLAEEFDAAPDLAAEFEAAPDLAAEFAAAEDLDETKRTQRAFDIGEARWQQAGAQMAADEARTKENVLKRAVSVLSGGGPLVDELSGVAAAQGRLPAWAVEKLKEKLGGAKAGAAPVDAYRQRRDEVRATVRDAQREGPSVAGVPVLPVLGAIAPTLGTGLPATMAGRLALGTGLGAKQAAETSEADLTKGDVSGFYRDVDVGARMGAAGAALGEGFSQVGRLFGKAKGLAAQKVLEKTQAAQDKAYNVAHGGFRKGVQEMENVRQYLLDRADDLNLPQAARDEAQAIIDSPQMKSIAEKIYKGKMAVLDRLAPQYDELEAVRQAAAAARQPQAVQKLADEALERPWAPMTERTQRYLARSLPLEAGAKLDEVLGVSEAGPSRLVGATLSGVLGGAGTAFSNAVRNPLTPYLAGQIGERVSGAAAGATMSSVPAAVTWKAFAERYGYRPQDEQQMADDHYLRGQGE